ncbi:MAG: type II secretion system protein [Candidatus Melainabacteria bacterium]
MKSSKGFTLAELLIALAILGVIATFTIPKVLQASGEGQNTSIAKETISMVSGAFSAYQLSNPIATTTTTANLTTNMNYVSFDTATATVFTCIPANPCLVLHSGAWMQYTAAQAYTAGTTSTHYITFNVDPDGAGTVGHFSILQMANGRVTTGGNSTGLTQGSAGATLVTTDPAYVTW